MTDLLVNPDGVLELTDLQALLREARPSHHRIHGEFENREQRFAHHIHLVGTSGNETSNSIILMNSVNHKKQTRELPGNLSPQCRRGFRAEPLTQFGQALYGRVHVFRNSIKKRLYLSLGLIRNAAVKLSQDSMFVQDLRAG